MSNHWRRLNLRRMVARLLAGLLITAALAQAESRRRVKLYVTNSEGSTITVIDLATFKVSGEIKVGDCVHGLAAEAELGVNAYNSEALGL